LSGGLSGKKKGGKRGKLGTFVQGTEGKLRTVIGCDDRQENHEVLTGGGLGVLDCCQIEGTYPRGNLYGGAGRLRGEKQFQRAQAKKRVKRGFWRRDPGEDNRASDRKEGGGVWT